MNELAIFNNPEFGDIRTIEMDGEPWFVAADICRALDIGNPSQAVTRLDEDEKSTLISNEGKTMNIVSESGLYALVLSSRKPDAKAFKRWITHDVIPSIRKTGSYCIMDSYQIDDPIERAKRWIAEQEETQKLRLTVSVQNQQIAELQPKASYYDVVLNCKDLLSIGKIAKDFGKSAVWLNKWLHEKCVQYKQGDIWLLYQKYAEMGYTSTKTQTFAGDDGETHSKVHTYWTQKGRLFIYDLLKADGILPLVEREEESA